MADINFVVWKPKGSAGSGRLKFSDVKPMSFSGPKNLLLSSDPSSICRAPSVTMPTRMRCVALSFVLVYKVAGQTVLPPHLHDLKAGLLWHSFVAAAAFCFQVACQHLMEESTTDICTAPFWKGAIGTDLRLQALNGYNLYGGESKYLVYTGSTKRSEPRSIPAIDTRDLYLENP